MLIGNDCSYDTNTVKDNIEAVTLTCKRLSPMVWFYMHLPCYMYSWLILCISTTTFRSLMCSWLTITEMCRRCMCSCRTWAGSRAVGCVVSARSSDSVMDTWKYSVPFSNHCCFQCTWEISSPVPDISAENRGRKKKEKGLWDEHLIHGILTFKLCVKYTFFPNLYYVNI